MKFSPNKRWLNRDRFVLSVGHASALLYSMLHLVGLLASSQSSVSCSGRSSLPCARDNAGTGMGGPYEVCMEQLKQFRQAGSSTPGHPEFRMTSGVEVPRCLLEQDGCADSSSQTALTIRWLVTIACCLPATAPQSATLLSVSFARLPDLIVH